MFHSKTRSLVALAGCLSALPGCASFFSGNVLPRPTMTASSAQAPVALPARESAEACLTVAQSLATQGHDHDAIAKFERAREFDPKARGVAHRLGILYDRTGDSKRASAEFQLAMKEDPKNADLHNDVGYFHYNHGRWVESEQHFRQALTLKSDHAKAWTNLGLTLGQQERYPESLEAFGKVVSPSEAKTNLAFVLSTRGKREEAKLLYRQALEAEPDLKIARSALEKLESPSASRPAEPTPTPVVDTIETEVITVMPRE